MTFEEEQNDLMHYVDSYWTRTSSLDSNHYKRNL